MNAPLVRLTAVHTFAISCEMVSAPSKVIITASEQHSNCLPGAKPVDVSMYVEMLCNPPVDAVLHMSAHAA